MSFRARLFILVAVTVVGLLGIAAAVYMGLRSIDDSHNTAHRREFYLIDLEEIKASAISTIMLDPTVPETRTVFAEAEKGIADHSAVALGAIKREQLRAELKGVLEKWNQYDRSSQELIELARTNAKLANAKLVPLYNAEFRPLQMALDKFVADRKMEAQQAKDEAERDTVKVYWELGAAIAVIAIVNLVVVLQLSQVLQTRLNNILSSLEPLKAGILTARLPGSRDELGRITAGFNEFIKELQVLVEHIRSDADSVHSATSNLAAASTQVNASSQSQSDDSASVAAAVEEFSVSLDQVSENAHEALSKANLSGELAHNGETEVQNAITEFKQIEEAVNSATQQMEALGGQTQKISSFVSVITDVAEQTNLLALNAAIEAARAGESGRGFAVVADEVRKLAERTAASAHEITAMVSNIQHNTEQAALTMRQGNEKVGSGVRRAEQVGASMQQIYTSSTDVNSAVNDISSALSEQRSASNEIAKRVERIAQMTEENGAAMSSVSEAAAHLEMLAAGLQERVSKFKT